MNPAIISTLNRLLQTLTRSLANYLHDVRRDDDDDCAVAREAIENLAADQQRYAARVAEAIIARDGWLDRGGYPHAFCDLNDLNLSYLLGRAAASHARDVETIRGCACVLADEPELHELAEEILGNAQGHQELLERARAASGACPSVEDA